MPFIIISSVLKYQMIMLYLIEVHRKTCDLPFIQNKDYQYPLGSSKYLEEELNTSITSA